MYFRHQITQAAELETLPVFRKFIKETCEQHPEISEQTIHDLQLAVEEASMNIITHGYSGMNPGSIILALELFSQQVVVALTDFGHPFEPSEPPAPDIAAKMENREPVGGFGLFIIYQTMDEISYETMEDGNCLTFIKKLGNQLIKDNRTKASPS